MQDRSPPSTKLSCDARPDHTLGQTLQVRCTPRTAQCPLRSESDRIAASPRNVAKGHFRTSRCLVRSVLSQFVLMVLSFRPDPMYGNTRFKPSLVRELLKNGDVPKSPLLSIGSPGAVGRHNSTHNDFCVVSRVRSLRARQRGRALLAQHEGLRGEFGERHALAAKPWMLSIYERNDAMFAIACRVHARILNGVGDNCASASRSSKCRGARSEFPSCTDTEMLGNSRLNAARISVA